MERISREDLFSSLGLGASEIASACHLSPWQSAYELWRIKTGRARKPPQSAAMRYGIELEETAFQAWAKDAGIPGAERQVAAHHPVYEWLRAIADVWVESQKFGVEIKVPSSPNLMNSMKRGVVPAHYLAQVAGEMYVFNAPRWEFFVWQDNESEMIEVDWQTEIMDGMKLAQWWDDYGLPGIELLWSRVTVDEWELSGGGQADDGLLDRLAAKRAELAGEIDALDEEKTLVESQMKLTLADQKWLAGQEWTARWTPVKASHELIVKCENEEALAEVQSALGHLAGVKGVEAIEPRVRANSWRFDVKRANRLNLAQVFGAKEAK